MKTPKLASAAVILALASIPTAAHSCTVSAAQFEWLRTGMQYPEIAQALNCPGRVMTEGQIGGHRMATYVWQGHGGPGANMIAMFQDDRLFMKAQSGLR